MSRSPYPLALLLTATTLAAAIADTTSNEVAPDRILKELFVGAGRNPGEPVVIAGRDGMQQLIVSSRDTSGSEHDETRRAKFETIPAGIVAIDETGLVTPVSEGKAVVRASVENLSAEIEIEVTHLAVDLPINFTNDVVPLFTKHGCNGGGCHGKASGQNGFRLSLLGFEPHEDYEFLIKEGRGRRLFPAAPDRSLLLQKAAAVVPHGGGQRIELDSPPYRVLRRWISQGMPLGKETDPKVIGIDVFPKVRVLKPGDAQQLAVVARYSDGSVRGVTRMTQLESNDAEMAEVTESGLVKTEKQTGTVAIMARFQGHVDVFRATLPLGIDVNNLPQPANLVDNHVFQQLKQLGLPPSENCSDSTFLRRSAIAIAGRLPTLEETKAFLANHDPSKREEWIDQLLDSESYADNFATKWSSILRNKRNNNDERRSTFAFYRWIRDSLYENKPYDEFVRDIVTASGDVSVFPAVAWYRQVRDQSALVEDTAQLFLGMRIQCAKCHHHPFEKWSQKDYHSFSAFYSRIGRKPTEFRNQERIVHNFGKATAKNPKTGEVLLPTGLDATPLELEAFDDPRHALADWMVSADNPFFAKALVNRYWKHFFGRGLVDPEDDMRVTNPATNPELLDALTKDFIDSGFDLKHLVRTICNSKTFQFAADPNQYNQKDKQNFSRFYPKRLDAEVLLDSIDVMTGVQTSFGGLPKGTKAIQLPDTGFDSYFLTVFGRPEASSACECERSAEASLAQSLHLLNSKDILGKISSDQGRAAALTNDERPIHEKIEELYYLAFSRKPTEQELAIATKHIETREKPREGFEDVVWALINTKEFLFNH